MASKSNKGEILAKFFDDGEYTALFADGAVSAACGYAAGQQAYAVYQNGEAVSVKDVEKNIKVLEMAAQTGCPVVTFYNSVGAKLAEGLDVLTASAKLNATIAKVSGVIPQIAVVTGVCGGTSALSAANADVCVMAEDAELFFTAPFTSAAKGDKVASKKLADEAKVSTIPGYNDPIDTPGQAVEIAKGIGYPVMIKASAGGGPRRTASSAICTKRASLSASEYTATVAMPIFLAVAMTRQAISPRLAIRILVNMMCFLAFFYLGQNPVMRAFGQRWRNSSTKRCRSRGEIRMRLAP